MALYIPRLINCVSCCLWFLLYFFGSHTEINILTVSPLTASKYINCVGFFTYDFFVTFRLSLTVYTLFQFYSFVKSYVMSKTTPRGRARSNVMMYSESLTPLSQWCFFVTFRVSLTVYALFRFYSFVKGHVMSKRPLGGVLGQSLWRILIARPYILL